jgi:glyoxylase-like metal-dependent hydrolase (beta-lactamase superfamily II)
MIKFFFAAALLACFASPAAAITPDKAEFKKLADGVYAYVGKLNDANAMVVATSQGVVVVDTGNNQPETRNIQKYIQSVTQQPVRYVVITQNHGDHIGGDRRAARAYGEGVGELEAVPGEHLAQALPRPRRGAEELSSTRRGAHLH